MYIVPIVPLVTSLPAHSLLCQCLWTECGEHAQCLVSILVGVDDQEGEQIGGGPPSSPRTLPPLERTPCLCSTNELTAKITSLNGINNKTHTAL